MSRAEEKPTLTLGDDGLEIPEDVDLSDGVVFRARGAMVDHKPGSPDRRVYPALDERHLSAEDREVINKQLDEREVSLKPYGEEARTYRVEIAATDGGQRTVQIGQVDVAIDADDTVLDLFDRIGRDGDILSLTPGNTVLCRPYSGGSRPTPPPEEDRISADLEVIEDGDKLELYRLPVSERPAYPELLVSDGGAEYDQIERGLSALERIADELEYQNAVLTEQAHAQHLTAVAGSDHADPDEQPTSSPTTRSMLTKIRDNESERDRAEDGRLMSDGGAREETIKNWLVINWREGTTRTRKSKPDPSSLGTHELTTSLTLNVTIPDVDVPELRADVEVPQPRVEASELSDLEAEDSPDWMDVADEIVAENSEADPYDEVDQLVVAVLEDAPGRQDVEEVKRYLQTQLRQRGAGQ